MRKLASIRLISALEPIEGADAIELAKVDGWQCVVKKGEFIAGQHCIYFEIDSVLPNELWAEFLGSNKRIKTKKLRGALSQGLALPLPGIYDGSYAIGEDITSRLGVTKYEPAQDSSLGGDAAGSFPSHLLPKTDEERVQNCNKELNLLQGKAYTTTVKLDGTSFTAFKLDGELNVCSRTINLRESEGNAHWQMARKYRLAETLPEGFAIQGELCGPKIQGNLLSLPSNELFVFNVIKLEGQKRLSYECMLEFCHPLNLQCVPLEESGESFNYTANELLAKADGKYASGRVREGIVIRSADYSTSFKAISNKYLLKGGN